MKVWKKILITGLAFSLVTGQTALASSMNPPASSVVKGAASGEFGIFSAPGGVQVSYEAPGASGNGNSSGAPGSSSGAPGSGSGSGAPGSSPGVSGTGSGAPGSGNGSGAPGSSSGAPGNGSGSGGPGSSSSAPGSGSGSGAPGSSSGNSDDSSRGPGVSSAGPGGGGGTSITTVTTTPGPTVQAKGAALYNVTTGQFLYTKDGDSQYYPASITKLMTALLVAENCSLDDTVTYSQSAVSNLESGAVTLKLAAGDQLTVRQSLYGLLLKSANEVANGLAENVSGSVSAFAGKMNERARAIGCTNTNFVNPNGLNNSNHYTTPHDMALIGAEAFKNATVTEVASTLTYQIPATKLAGARTVTMGHKMLDPKSSMYYPGIVAGKTGYTSKAGNTLVTCAEKNGTRLLAVVMKSSQTHYQDTKAMLDYGFSVAANPTARWVQDSKGWYFLNTDNTYPANQWMNIDSYYYWFEPSGYMATGWKQLNGVWYYLKPSGVMAQNYWVQSNGKWYYMGPNGTMLTNTTTPDGYYVDGNGVWAQ